MRAPRLAFTLGVAAAAFAATAVAAEPTLAERPPASGESPRTAYGHPTRGVAASAAPRIEFFRWGPATVRNGQFSGTRVHGGIAIGHGTTAITYRDPYGARTRARYDRGRWTSAWHEPGFGLTQLIASYQATTPVGTFIEVSARGRTGGGRMSSWDSLGRWASHDSRFHRMSLGSQTDDLSRVSVDTLITRSGVRFTGWQLRVSVYRRTGTTKTPTVTMVGAMSSRLPGGRPPTSTPGPGVGLSLQVPRYSQEIHAGEYPQWNGGGEAWCSPTSTAMAIAYWGRGPTPKQYAWVRPSYRQPWVDYAARFTYAWGYDGTGDWPFNTAYAARFGLDSFVTRLRSLRQAGLFIKAGIPLVASIAFGRGELDGAPISSTNGHLLVIRGFTDTGDVIVNDPAARTAKGVRRVYDRGQFERAWVGATGGVVYVIHPRSTPLPGRGVS